MADFMQTLNFPSVYPYPQDFGGFHSQTAVISDDSVKVLANAQPKPEPPPPPPVVICPTEVDNVNITLEKNQQCACKDCGKLFNSVWYLKQHAVKHSNDRPFKCKFCFKTYKFRSNLYQHKCPDRQRSNGQQGRRLMRGSVMMSPSARRQETNQLLKSRIEANMNSEEPQQSGLSDNEDNDMPIQYGLNIRIENSTDVWQPPPPVQIQVEPPPAPRDCIRERQLPQPEIDSYLALNKHKLFSCRKCRLLFPTEETLERHNGMHTYEETFCYGCPNCREAFASERDLRAHSLTHAALGPWKCDSCCGTFRSNVALRRHQDLSMECTFYPFGIEPDLMPSPSYPMDPYSFIVSTADQLITPSAEELGTHGPDSGLGSEASPHSFHASPDRALMPSEEDLDEVLFGKKPAKPEKDDDEDSGFRSRLNSVTQSCSPGSSTAESSEGHGGSPVPKLPSGHADSLDMSFSMTDLGTGYGSGPAYGTMMSHHFEHSVGGLSFSAGPSLADAAHSDSVPGGPSVLAGPAPTLLLLPTCIPHRTALRAHKDVLVEPVSQSAWAAAASAAEFPHESPQPPVSNAEPNSRLDIECIRNFAMAAVVETIACTFYVNVCSSLLVAAMLTKNERADS